MIDLHVHVHWFVAFLQVVELALTKLFDNFSTEELTSSMVQLMVSVNTKPEVWGEETPERMPTRQQRPTITVREVI